MMHTAEAPAVNDRVRVVGLPGRTDEPTATVVEVFEHAARVLIDGAAAPVVLRFANLTAVRSATVPTRYHYVPAGELTADAVLLGWRGPVRGLIVLGTVAQVSDVECGAVTVTFRCGRSMEVDASDPMRVALDG